MTYALFIIKKFRRDRISKVNVFSLAAYCNWIQSCRAENSMQLYNSRAVIVENQVHKAFAVLEHILRKDGRIALPSAFLCKHLSSCHYFLYKRVLPNFCFCDFSPSTFIPPPWYMPHVCCRKKLDFLVCFIAPYNKKL